jgi:hypothetical protein
MRKVLLSLMAAVGFAVAMAVVGNPERAQAIYCYSGPATDDVFTPEKFVRDAPAPECGAPPPPPTTTTTPTTPPPPPPPTTTTTTTPTTPVPPPPPPSTPSIPQSALPPDSVAEFDSAGSDRELQVSITERCKWAYAGIRFKNRVTQTVWWTYRVSTTFCYMGNLITKVYGQVGESIQAAWPWFFQGNLTPPQTSGGLTMKTVYAQGRYEACASPHIGCIRSVAPWVRLNVIGGGGLSYTWGVG